MIKEIVESLKMDFETIYRNVKNPYDSLESKVGGVLYSKLPDEKVPAGTMFYAINKNGKKVSTRAQTPFTGKTAYIAGKEYFVTNKLQYPSKQWISELMFSLKK